MLIGAGRVVVVLVGTSPSLSLWLFSRDCCLCGVEPKWPPSLRQSNGWSLSHWLALGSSALCCVSCLGRVVVLLIGTGRFVVVIDWNFAFSLTLASQSW